jgi:hypothetical protein
MIWAARIGVVLAGLFSLTMGVMAIISPGQLGNALGIGALSPIGLNSLRADLGSFFLASVIACVLALFANRPQWLWGAAALYGLAVIGRFIGIVVDGPPTGIVTPIVIELVMVGLLVFGAKKLGRS